MRSAASCAAAANAPASVTSTAKAWPSTSLATWPARLPSTSTTATVAPPPPARRHVARPMPDPPPVTSPFFPASSPIDRDASNFGRDHDRAYVRKGGRLAGEVGIVTGSTSGLGRPVGVSVRAGGGGSSSPVAIEERRRAVTAAIGAERRGSDVRARSTSSTRPRATRSVATAVERFGSPTALVKKHGRRYRPCDGPRHPGRHRGRGGDVAGQPHCYGAALPGRHPRDGRGGPRIDRERLVAVPRTRTPGLTAYAASKGGMNALTRSIAVDYARDNVRCNTVSPGYILHERRDADLDDDRRRRLEGMHLTRLGTAADVALRRAVPRQRRGRLPSLASTRRSTVAARRARARAGLTAWGRATVKRPVLPSRPRHRRARPSDTSSPRSRSSWASAAYRCPSPCALRATTSSSRPGFVLTEGLVARPADVRAMRYCTPEPQQYNVLDVELASGVDTCRPRLRRGNFFTSSSWGLAARRASMLSVPARPTRWLTTPCASPPPPSASLPPRPRDTAACSRRPEGCTRRGFFAPCAARSSALREDVGRHNAFDKVIGWAALEGRLPLSSHVIVASGRAGFELVQKALMAGIPALAAVSAPSSLAVELADEAGMTLVGFLRGESMNVYARPAHTSAHSREARSRRGAGSWLAGRWGRRAGSGAEVERWQAQQRLHVRSLSGTFVDAIRTRPANRTPAGGTLRRTARWASSDNL